MMGPSRNDRFGAGTKDRRNEAIGRSTTGATGRFSALARLAVAIGFGATLLVGQAVVFDSTASAKMDETECQQNLDGCLFERWG
jgi:hypothetical protein